MSLKVPFLWVIYNYFYNSSRPTPLYNPLLCGLKGLFGVFGHLKYTNFNAIGYAATWLHLFAKYKGKSSDALPIVKIFHTHQFVAKNTDSYVKKIKSILQTF